MEEIVRTEFRKIFPRHLNEIKSIVIIDKCITLKIIIEPENYRIFYYKNKITHNDVDYLISYDIKYK
jgi:hypothetical protein